MSEGVIRLAAGGLLCAACVSLAGCIFVSDNSEASRLPTVGKELRDLKRARDEGALEPEQYHQARDRVPARLDKPCN